MSQPFPTADLPWNRVRRVEVLFVVLETACLLGSVLIWVNANDEAQRDETGLAFLGVFFAWACLAFFVPALICTTAGLVTRRSGPLFVGKLLTLLGIFGGPFVLLLGAFLVLGALF